MDVSENRGTPKSSILKGCSIINHSFWGTPIFGNTQMFWKQRLVYSRWWQLKYFWNLHPEPCGKWSKFDEHMFQMGWFNHQLVGAKCYLWGFASTLLFDEGIYVHLASDGLPSLPWGNNKKQPGFQVGMILLWCFCSFFGGQPLQEKMSVPTHVGKNLSHGKAHSAWAERFCREAGGRCSSSWMFWAHNTSWWGRPTQISTQRKLWGWVVSLTATPIFIWFGNVFGLLKNVASQMVAKKYDEKTDRRHF